MLLKKDAGHCKFLGTRCYKLGKVRSEVLHSAFGSTFGRGSAPKKKFWLSPLPMCTGNVISWLTDFQKKHQVNLLTVAYNWTKLWRYPSILMYYHKPFHNCPVLAEDQQANRRNRSKNFFWKFCQVMYELVDKDTWWLLVCIYNLLTICKVHYMRCFCMHSLVAVCMCLALSSQHPSSTLDFYFYLLMKIVQHQFWWNFLVFFFLLSEFLVTIFMVCITAV